MKLFVRKEEKKREKKKEGGEEGGEGRGGKRKQSCLRDLAWATSPLCFQTAVPSEIFRRKKKRKKGGEGGGEGGGRGRKVEAGPPRLFVYANLHLRRKKKKGKGEKKEGKEEE